MSKQQHPDTDFFKPKVRGAKNRQTEPKDKMTAPEDATPPKQFRQMLENLPAEMRDAPRYFRVAETKAPIQKGWSKTENQRFAAQINGLKGFDTSGHGVGVDYLVLDFDHVLDDDGNFIYPEAERWYNYIMTVENVFCERSISGHGLHIYLVPTEGKFKSISSGQAACIYFDKATGAKLELFYKTGGRYFLVTGELYGCEAGAIIPHGEVADEIFQNLLQATEKNQAAKKKSDAEDKPARELGKKTAQDDYPEDTPEKDLFRAKRMLDLIEPADLTDSDWLAVNSACQNIGVEDSLIDQFNRRDPERYNEEENRKRLNSLTDPSFTIETLHGIAKRFGYQQADINREWREQHPTAHRRQNAARHQFAEDKITTDIIPSCPISLVVPPDVIFDSEGITMVVESRGRNKTSSYLPAAGTPIVPTKIFRDEKSGTVQYEVAILTQGKWRRHVVDGRTIQSARCIDKLANFGALIEHAPSLCKFFTRIIAANNDRLKTWRVFNQPGWFDEKFQSFVSPSGGETYIVDRGGYHYTVDYAERGDADQWKRIFATAMHIGGRVARVFVGVAVAAPLIRPLGIHNLQVHLFGGINSGKSVLARLIASIFGRPTKLIQTFEASPKRRQADAAANNDLPIIYDELETVKGQRGEESLTQSVYAFFNGKGNQNMNIDGTARDTFEFAGTRLSTGERQILKVADQFGAYKRLLPLEIKAKIFDKKFATELYKFTAENFGHFGRAWTTYIAAHLDEIRKRYEAQEKISLGDDLHEETQIRTICAGLVAYQFFAMCIGLQNKFDESIFLDDLAETLSALPTFEDMSDSARALNVLRDVVASRENHFYIETTNTNQPNKEYEPKSFADHYGKIYLKGAVAIYPTVLREILIKAGFASPDMLIATWHDEGKLITNEGRKTNNPRIGGIKKRAIHFKGGILSEPRTEKPLTNNDGMPPD